MLAVLVRGGIDSNYVSLAVMYLAPDSTNKSNHLIQNGEHLPVVEGLLCKPYVSGKPISFPSNLV